MRVEDYTEQDILELAYCLMPFKLGAARELLEHIGSARRFFEASENDLRSIGLRHPSLCDRKSRAEVISLTRREIEFAVANNIRVLRYTDPDYPQRLLECIDAPTVLFALGTADFNAPGMVGVVGTRLATPYGCGFVDSLVENLGEVLTETPTIISGLAYGIDVTAHRAALNRQIPTVAVLAHGLRRIYPAAHHDVARSIVRSGGALVTEYTSDTVQNRGSFLARNRIVAGMSDALVVAESDDKGGAMTTARLAAEYSRDVFALPGRVGDRLSRGCNTLIRKNIAGLITSADDLIDAMRWSRRVTEPVQGSLFEELSAPEQAIHDCLAENGEANVSRLLAVSGLGMGMLMATLVDMEARHIVAAYPGGNYRLT